MTKEKYIDELQGVSQQDLDDGQYAWGDALFDLRDTVAKYKCEFNDDTPQKMLDQFITQDEAAEMARKYLDDDNLIGLRRFLVGSVIYDSVVKLDEHNELEDTSPDEMFAVRDAIIEYIRNNDK